MIQKWNEEINNLLVFVRNDMFIGVAFAHRSVV